MDFEKYINELRTQITFKSTIEVKDIVLIISKAFLGFGIVNNIVKDKMKKGDWWSVSFTIFSVPLKPLSWILRTPQMTGQETFSINGENMFFAVVDVKKEIPKEEPTKEPIKKPNPFKLVKK